MPRPKPPHLHREAKVRWLLPARENNHGIEDCHQFSTLRQTIITLPTSSRGALSCTIGPLRPEPVKVGQAVPVRLDRVELLLTGYRWVAKVLIFGQGAHPW